MRTLREVLAILGLVFLIVSICVFWPQLPSRIPTHFGDSGLPNGFGSKASVSQLPFVTAILYAGLSALSLVPMKVGYPPEITPEQRSRLQQLGVAMIGWLKVEVVWTFACLNWTVLRIALGHRSDLSDAFSPVTTIAVFATIGIYWLQIRKVQPKPAEEQT